MPKWFKILALLILLSAGAIYYGNSQKRPVIISQVSYDSPFISFIAQNTTDTPLMANLLISSSWGIKMPSSAESQIGINLEPHEKKMCKEYFGLGRGVMEVTVISVENN